MRLLFLPLAVIALLVLTAAGSQAIFKIRNGDTLYVNRNVICVVEEGGIYCALRKKRGFAIFLNRLGVTVSRADTRKPVLVCLHEDRCSG